ncbi:MAG: aminotransferase class I/II-fold pyridoxal phosphate-dependent enzyme [Ruminococcaceae bacterium]|nr:aminotransferase class I/II-fold pyridoxal phosphate-dependent enzyme [Oscillospiraceae bacterium]
MSIYEYLNEFSEISFHMPGHKGNIPVPIVDVTELSGTDNLMCPEGIIKEAQEKMAKVLGKKETFFLTGGATGGILASVLATITPGERVLVDRNCHASVIYGLILAGGIPKFVYPKINEEFGIPCPLSAEDIDYNGEKILIVTSPTYYGEVANIKEIRETVGDITIIQDEAHGAHFYFDDALASCRTNESDLTVLSFHKTMPTLNQGAVLCCNTARIPSKKIKQAINMVHTTSPSYPILSSLDYSGTYGRKLYQNTLVAEKIKELSKELTEKTPLKILANQDSYKLLLNCDGTNYSAEELDKYLQKNYKIYAEGVFGNNLLLMFSPCNKMEEIKTLSKALFKLDWKEKETTKTSYSLLKLKQVMAPRDAYFAEGEWISAKEAVGRISKENITRFPPCVPIVTVGEELSEEAVKLIDNEEIYVVK